MCENGVVILSQKEYNEFKETAVLVREIHQHIIGSTPFSETIHGYVSESDAKNLLNRKTTWFWQQRKSGSLEYKKIGSTVYYKKDDLMNLLKH